MGFSVYFQSTEPVSETVAAKVVAATDQAAGERTWLSCEPIFPTLQEDGHLWGGSKLTFEPDPLDIESAEQEGLPNGTIADVIQLLCDISREHGIDWEVGHDFGELGGIHNGIADPEMTQAIDALALTTEELLSGMMGESYGDDEEDDDGPPDILRFPG